MSPHPPERRKSGGRPAGFVLAKYGDGKKHGGKPAVAVAAGAVDLEGLAVTREEVLALHPRKEVTLGTRIMAVLLHKLRVQAGLSQGALARRSRLTRQEIGQLEHADHGIKLDTLRALCGVFNIRAGRLVDVAEGCEQALAAGRG